MYSLVGISVKKRTWKNQDGSVTESWRLEIKDYSTGKPRSIYPARQHYPRYGVESTDSLEVAREKIKSLQALNNIDRLAERRAKVEKRIFKDELKESAYLPKALYRKFLLWLTDRRLWDEIPPKTESHLRCLRRLVLSLNIDPSEWPNKPEKIYRWFITEKLSLSYVDKVLPLMNEYGYFYCKQFKKPYLAIKKPTGDIARRIDDANIEARNGSQAPSSPITLGLLEKLSDLPENQFRWLRLTVWFGFRPSEVDELLQRNRKKVWDIFQDKNGVWVLSFYQSKLVRIERDRRWKRIPAILPEQVRLIEELQEMQPFKRPLLKSIESRIGGEYGLYGGRKNFESLMRGFNQKNENISRWLGHQDLNRIERNYRELEAVGYDPVVREVLRRRSSKT